MSLDVCSWNLEETKMKAALFVAPGKVEIRDIPVRSPKRVKTLIRIPWESLKFCTLSIPDPKFWGISNSLWWRMLSRSLSIHVPALQTWQLQDNDRRWYYWPVPLNAVSVVDVTGSTEKEPKTKKVAKSCCCKKVAWHIQSCVIYDKKQNFEEGRVYLCYRNPY